MSPIKPKLISVLNSIVIMAALCFVAASATQAATKPNIVFFFIDDMGWTDLTCMGSEYYETPNIDRLAKEGVIFTDAYANAPNCAPSRACLMSGKYSPRHGVFTVGTSSRGKRTNRKLEPTKNTTELDDKFITIAEALGANGYVSASMGKWHLGPNPQSQGFDVNIAGKQWGSPSGGGYHSPFKYPNLVTKKKGEYLTDRLTDKAVEFIATNKAQPFFLYLTHYAVHTPIQAKADLTAKYSAKPASSTHSNAKYAAMIESVDDSVGRVLAKLDELKLTQDTFVMFFSDNGGHGGATSNKPLRGAKGMLYEGGIRVPLIVKWAGVTPAKTKCNEPVIGVDVYPTLLELTGTEKPQDYELDGKSLVSLFKTPQSSLSRDAIFWHFPCYLEGSGDPHGGPFRTTPAGAIRMGDWKLIEWFESGRLELYNLKHDLSEKHDLSKSNPEQLEKLHTAMKAWRKKVDAPVPTERTGN